MTEAKKTNSKNPKPKGFQKETFNYNPLTDNFKANMMFMSFGFIAVACGSMIGHFARPSPSDLNQFISITLGYFFGSYWMSPDLDHIENRPGKYSFPIKPIVKALRTASKSGGRAGALLFALPLVLAETFHGVFNAVWRMMWQPFAAAVTHRGIIHMPVIGTLLKWYWLALIIDLAARVGVLLPSSDVLSWIKSQRLAELLPLAPGDFLTSNHSLFGSLFKREWWTTSAMVAAGLMAADITHIMVDAWDSRGRNFVPPAIIAPRGIFYRILQAFVTFWRF